MVWLFQAREVVEPVSQRIRSTRIASDAKPPFPEGARGVARVLEQTRQGYHFRIEGKIILPAVFRGNGHAPDAGPVMSHRPAKASRRCLPE